MPAPVKINSQLNIQGVNTSQVVKGINQIGNAANKNLGRVEQFADALDFKTKNLVAYTIVSGAIIRFSRVITSATRDAIKYQSELARIAQTNDLALESTRNLSKEILAVSKTYVISAIKVAETVKVLTQAGVSFREATDAAKSLAKTTLLASFDDYETTLNGVIAAMKQFNIEGSKVEELLGSINLVSKRYAVESNDLVESIIRAGGVFSTAGDSVEELLALITSVRGTTRESAETIATGFRTIFARLQRPKTIEYFKELGIQLNTLEGDFIGNFESIQKISQGLERAGIAAGSLKFAEVIEEIGGIRQSSRVIPLLTQTRVQLEALNLAKTAGASIDEDIAIQQKTLEFRVRQLSKEFGALFIEISESKGFKTFAAFLIEVTSLTLKLVKALSGISPLLTVFSAFGGFKLASRALTGPQSLLKANTGIKVPGIGNRDTVPAMLTPGEFVINKRAAQEFGYGNLQEINGYNSGGVVGKIKSLLGLGSAESVPSDKAVPGTIKTQREAEKQLKALIESLGDAGKALENVSVVVEKLEPKIEGTIRRGNVSGDLKSQKISLDPRYAVPETLNHEAGHVLDGSLGDGKRFSSEIKGTFQFGIAEAKKKEVKASLEAAGASKEYIEYATRNREIFANLFKRADSEMQKILVSTSDAKEGFGLLANRKKSKSGFKDEKSIDPKVREQAEREINDLINKGPQRASVDKSSISPLQQEVDRLKSLNSQRSDVLKKLKDYEARIAKGEREVPNKKATSASSLPDNMYPGTIIGKSEAKMKAEAEANARNISEAMSKAASPPQGPPKPPTNVASAASPDDEYKYNRRRNAKLKKRFSDINPDFTTESSQGPPLLGGASQGAKTLRPGSLISQYQMDGTVPEYNINKNAKLRKRSRREDTSFTVDLSNDQKRDLQKRVRSQTQGPRAKEFSENEIQSVLNGGTTVDPLVKKSNRLKAEIARRKQLTEESKDLEFEQFGPERPPKKKKRRGGRTGGSKETTPAEQAIPQEATLNKLLLGITALSFASTVIAKTFENSNKEFVKALEEFTSQISKNAATVGISAGFGQSASSSIVGGISAFRNRDKSQSLAPAVGSIVKGSLSVASALLVFQKSLVDTSNQLKIEEARLAKEKAIEAGDVEGAKKAARTEVDLQEAITKADIAAPILAGLGGVIGGLIGSVFGPIGQQIGSQIGASLGNFLAQFELIQSAVITALDVSIESLNGYLSLFGFEALKTFSQTFEEARVAALAEARSRALFSKAVKDFEKASGQFNADKNFGEAIGGNEGLEIRKQAALNFGQNIKTIVSQKPNDNAPEDVKKNFEDEFNKILGAGSDSIVDLARVFAQSGQDVKASLSQLGAEFLANGQISRDSTGIVGEYIAALKANGNTQEEVDAKLKEMSASVINVTKTTDGLADASVKLAKFSEAQAKISRDLRKVESDRVSNSNNRGLTAGQIRGSSQNPDLKAFAQATQIASNANVLSIQTPGERNEAAKTIANEQLDRERAKIEEVLEAREKEIDVIKKSSSQYFEFLDVLTFGSNQDKRQQEAGLKLAKQAATSGIGSISPSKRKDVEKVLDQFSDLAVFNGKTGNQVKTEANIQTFERSQGRKATKEERSIIAKRALPQQERIAQEIADLKTAIIDSDKKLLDEERAALAENNKAFKAAVDLFATAVAPFDQQLKAQEELLKKQADEKAKAKEVNKKLAEENKTKAIEERHKTSSDQEIEEAVNDEAKRRKFFTDSGLTPEQISKREESFLKEKPRTPSETIMTSLASLAGKTRNLVNGLDPTGSNIGNTGLLGATQYIKAPQRKKEFDPEKARKALGEIASKRPPDWAIPVSDMAKKLNSTPIPDGATKLSPNFQVEASVEPVQVLVNINSQDLGFFEKALKTDMWGKISEMANDMQQKAEFGAK